MSTKKMLMARDIERLENTSLSAPFILGGANDAILPGIEVSGPCTWTTVSPATVPIIERLFTGTEPPQTGDSDAVNTCGDTVITCGNADSCQGGDSCADCSCSCTQIGVCCPTGEFLI